MQLTLTLVGVALIVLFLLLEAGLRLLFGFGNPLLYLGDPQIGYLLAPNQKTRRFGNHIEINQYSMRSGAITAQRAPDTQRILIIGDSIVNGGWWTDQQNIISAMLQRDLQNRPITNRARQTAPPFASPHDDSPTPAAVSRPVIEVLNASANSWGPRNELAYLQRFGCFEAQIVVLVINTDDLFATAPTALPVGADRNYPDRKPLLAIAEAVNRFLPPPPVAEALQAVQAEPGDRVGFNLEAIQQIHTLTQQSQAQLLLIMTPLLREIGQPGSRDYEIRARQRLSAFVAAEHIPYIDFLPIFNALPQPQALYQDHIHLNPAGNRAVSEQIQQWLDPSS
jgi:GDSL-like Lipase/Acylhydrolase family